MRIITLLLAVACITLAAGCSDSDSNVNLGQNGSGNGADNGGGNAGNLSNLVFNQCKTTPENTDPVAINGRSFAAGANDPNNQAFTNNCL